MLKVGTQVVEFFSVSVSGIDTSVAAYGADVRRNGVVTTVPILITEVSTGTYQTLFDVPTHWTDDDRIHVAFTINHMSENLTSVKYVGTIGAATVGQDTQQTIDRTLNLLEADETYDAETGKARKLLRGTNTVLLEKDVTRSSDADSVSLRD